MSFFMEIDGVTVSSDKDAAGVNGSRVEFTDGSWCDVVTGDMDNVGPGRITLNGSSKTSLNKGNTLTGEPHSYVAGALRVKCPMAKINVQPHLGSDLVVAISGPRKQVEQIKVNVVRGVLVIEQASSTDSGANVVISGGGIVIGNVSGRGIHIGNISVGSSQPAVTVDVRVPVGTPVSLIGSMGQAEIGDIEAPVEAAVTAGDVVIGRITHLDLTIAGSGDVTATKVRGNARIRIKGAGDVRIVSSEIDDLVVSIVGSGDVKVGGTAQQAHLTISGSGDIVVSRVVGDVEKRVNGSGDITIKRRG